MVRAAWLFILLVPAVWGQGTPSVQASTAKDSALLTAGRQLVAQLALDQQKDRAVFENIGVDRAVPLLMAVMGRGQSLDATPAEWTEMHRAISGLIEFYAIKGDFFRAALFSNVQAIYFRHDEQDYTAALSASRQALELQQKSGQTQTLYIDWQNVGEDLIRLGRLDEGLDSLYQAHRIIDNPLSTLAGVIWREIVEGEIARGNMDAARAAVKAFVERSEDTSATDRFRGEALLAHADVEIQATHYDEALDNVRAAERALLGDKDQTAFSYESTNELLTIGMLAIESLPYAEAMALAKRIDAEFPNLAIPVSPFAREVMEYRRRLAGDFGGLLHEDAAALEKARAIGDVRGQIAALTRLAVTYAFFNSSSQEITLLEEALGLEQSLLPQANVPADATAQESHFRLLIQLGTAYADAKEPEKASRCFSDALVGMGSIAVGSVRYQLADLYAEAKLGEALVAEMQGRTDTAREILASALNAPPNPAVKFRRPDVLLQFARLERNLNERPLDALHYYQEAIQAYHNAKDIRTEISVRLQLGRYLAVEALTRVPEAQNIANENLKLADAAAASIEFADAQWRVRFLEGIGAENAGDVESAIGLYTQSVAKLDRLRAGLPQQEQRQAFMDSAAISELYERLIALLTKSGREAQAWEYLERSKARSFLEALQGRRFRSSSAGNSELEALEKQILKLHTQLSPSNAAVLRAAGKSPALVRSELQTLEARFAVARQQAGLVSSRSAQPLSLSPITLAAVRKALPARTALVEYAVLDGMLTAFVATSSSSAQFHWTVDTKQLAADIRQLRDLLSNDGSGEQLDALLRRVSSMLIDHVVDRLPAGTARLVIVPARELNYIPFQALLLPGGQSMIDRYTITYLPSASTLQFLKPNATRYKGDLFLGALGNMAVDGMPRLPGTLLETASIHKLYSHSERFVERNFTHARAIRGLLDHEQVHFATHGLLDEKAPLFSGLLTGRAGNEGSSRLSLYEVMDLRLKARLVVLSACETNLGKLMGGDEVAGLTRTFLQAGAETVVSSLWTVSDESTALLMQGFYRELRAGASPSDALRRAELAVRKEFPDPFFWAPFVETGVD